MQLIIDLDDTLVDTFDLLIRPLEADAAQRLHEQGLVDLMPEELAERLLQLRKSDPEALYDVLAHIAGEQGGFAVDTHRSIFSDFAVNALVLTPEVAEMLRALRKGNRLVLMTEGRTQVQLAKIDHLGLPELFDEMLIVDPACGDSKARRLADYMRRVNAAPEEIVVVGNRLDREIAAARSLGAKTIWLRNGEGSEADPGTGDDSPDVVIDTLLDLPRALESLRH